LIQPTQSPARWPFARAQQFLGRFLGSVGGTLRSVQVASVSAISSWRSDSPDQLDGEAGNEGERSLTGLSLRRRLKSPLEPVFRLPLPLLLAGFVVVGSALYFFAIGRNRYQVESSFIVRLPDTPPTSGSSLLGNILAGPVMLGSLEDGRFLSVYLTSPEVMKRVFLQLKPEETWAKDQRDPFAGLKGNANFDQQLEFFRRQVSVTPQDLTGVINLTTTGLKPEPAYRLNQLLLQEAEVFLNQVNQGISATQQEFAEDEVKRARSRLDSALSTLNAFKNANREIDPESSAQAAGSYISLLEGKLVELKVQEASLKRQFKDPTSPEVAYVSDQVRELERQIEEERAQLVNPEGRDLNRIVAEGSKLETEVVMATEALKLAITAATNSRQRTQQQVKFLIRLADPTIPEMQYFDWRIQGFLAVLGSLLVAWGIISFTFGMADRR